jgi:16S rRNA (guanine1207-N2)-methyltransferase
MSLAGAIDGEPLLAVPQGEFTLQRNPPDRRLQAWDAADELLLKHVHDGQFLSAHDRVLLLNDSFGALAVALANLQVFSWNDSWLAQQALRDNLRANGYAQGQVMTNSGIELPRAAVDCVLLKIPKTLALLEHQLYQLRAIVHHDSRIIAAGMARNIHSSALESFETILGPTTTTRAVKKSRLVLVQRDHSLNEGQSQYPGSFELQVDRDYRIVNHASLFSRDRLDPGTRLLLEHMPIDEKYRRIVDLGCGNGVLGLVAAALNPGSSLLFSDESYMAVASAGENFDAAFAGARAAEFRVGDCLQGIDADSRDLVLVNPPFHQQHSVGDAVAWQMFKDARRVLVDGGELRIVGNRHLGYHAKLKKLFGNCASIAANKKFVVLGAIKQQSG